MPKPIIYASGNERISGNFNVSHYILEKDDNFLIWLNDLLKVLNISKEKDEVLHISKNIENKEGETIGYNTYMKDLKKMVDVHERYEKEEKRLDLFYGKSRVYLTFRRSRDSRDVLAKFIVKSHLGLKIKKDKVESLPSFAGRRVKDVKE